MRHIDKLYMKALKLRPRYDDICIISNESGKWMIEKREYPTLDAAERSAREEYVRADEDLLIIINDAGPGNISVEQEVDNGGNQVKNKNTSRSEENTHKNNEHGSKRKAGCKDSEYHRRWV